MICSCEFEALVHKAVGNIRTRGHIKMKSKRELSLEFPFTNTSGKSTLAQRSGELVRIVRRSFVEVGVISFAGASVVSSTDVHLGRDKNPRRKIFASCMLD